MTLQDFYFVLIQPMAYQKKPYHTYFRFKIRNGIYYAIYKTMPNKKISTGQKREEDAINWAYAHMYTAEKTNNVTLKEFADSFFITGECPHEKRQLAKGKDFGADYLPLHRGRLVNYILPRFGSMLVTAINRREIDNWLISVNSRPINKDFP